MALVDIIDMVSTISGEALPTNDLRANLCMEILATILEQAENVDLDMRPYDDLDPIRFETKNFLTIDSTVIRLSDEFAYQVDRLLKLVRR